MIAAEQRIGELLLAIPKASGARTDLQTSSPYREEVKTKSETIKEMGYGKNEAADYQQMAKNPEVVQRVIDNALASGEVVTKTQYDRSVLALRLKPVIAEKAKEKQVEAGGAVRQKSDKAVIDTKKELANIAGVSHDTIHKVEAIARNRGERTWSRMM